MKLLIVALDAVLPAEVADAEVLVVAPALNSRLRHWLSDDDAARRRAAGQVAPCVEHLERRGVPAAGAVGDAGPVAAIADAPAVFAVVGFEHAAHSQAPSAGQIHAP